MTNLVENIYIISMKRIWSDATLSFSVTYVDTQHSNLGVFTFHRIGISSNGTRNLQIDLNWLWSLIRIDFSNYLFRYHKFHKVELINYTLNKQKSIFGHQK